MLRSMPLISATLRRSAFAVAAASQHCGVDPEDIDILMGTFTKSFGGMGGYIASSSSFIEKLKRQSSGALLSNSMSPIICRQIIRALDIIDGALLKCTPCTRCVQTPLTLRGGDAWAGKAMGDLGQKKLQAVYNNSNYFRDALIEMGCEVFGDDGSPVVPLMIYHPTKTAAFSRECLKRGLVCV